MYKGHEIWTLLDGSVIRIVGVDELGGATHEIIPDRIEAGTLLIAAGITGGELLIRKGVESPISREVGTMTAFPSFLYWRQEATTSGTKKMLFGTVSGPPFASSTNSQPSSRPGAS